MCGIFGWVAGESSDIPKDKYVSGIKRLFLLSETRGKEASGVCFLDQEKLLIYKEPVRAKKLIEGREFQELMKRSAVKNTFLMGHARMVTNGDNGISKNNQPVDRDDLFCIHNGIIVNDEEIWDKYQEMERHYQVDTEVLLGLLQKYHYEESLLDSLKESCADIKGSMSVALVDRTSDYLMLYTNVGSLYLLYSMDGTQLLFASERYILEQMIEESGLQAWFHKSKIKQIMPGDGYMINLRNCRHAKFSDADESYKCIIKGDRQRKLEQIEPESGKAERKSQAEVYASHYSELEKLFKVDEDKIRSLRRCTKCLIPATFPGIRYDSKGVCTICNNYTKKEVKGRTELVKTLLPTGSRQKSSNYDCIVPLSGGRDSCYIMHYIVKEMGLKPVAYTYDWGMVTDLARRNIQRMCSELQVEHILISADISKKRKNVQLNVNAWLKAPDLATIPLFMAGDKQFFYYAQLLKKQMRVDNILFGMNSLEETKFKVAFTGTKEKKDKDLYYNMSIINKIQLFTYYGMQFVKNPAYINQSLLDSFSGFMSYYILPQDYVQFFDYIPWEQKEIEDVILNQYQWEKAQDTEDTWRIGDGTAPFYNHIYYKLAGFTEFDTFKSNQIREGMLDRDKALEEVYVSNRGRLESFLWYCDLIGIDAMNALKTIDKKRPLYEK